MKEITVLSEKNIKSMKLYSDVVRIKNELREMGKDNESALTVDDLVAFDQLHYHGVEAIDIAIDKLGINSNSNVLEIGAGIGGPARYLATKSGASVTAIELQEDHHKVGAELTERCGLDKKVRHLCGDFLESKLAPYSFDAVVSWLAIYHIPNRPKLLNLCHSYLKSHGFFYTEDFALHSPLSKFENNELSKDFFANYLVSYSDYKKDLITAGFHNILLEDMTTSWSKFTEERYNLYTLDIERHKRVHNPQIVSNMIHFYGFAKRYLAGGKLGGIRILGQKQ